MCVAARRPPRAEFHRTFHKQFRRVNVILFIIYLKLKYGNNNSNNNNNNNIMYHIIILFFRKMLDDVNLRLPSFKWINRITHLSGLTNVRYLL